MSTVFKFLQAWNEASKNLGGLIAWKVWEGALVSDLYSLCKPYRTATNHISTGAANQSGGNDEGGNSLCGGRFPLPQSEVV